MKKILYYCCFSVIASIFFSSCKKAEITPYSESLSDTPTLPEVPYDYLSVDFPASFDSPPLNFISSLSPDNPITNEGVALGRVLFYDKNLSLNKHVSCASCHSQQHAFSDTKSFSTGLYGGQTTRNSMSIFNTRFSNRFFWDQRAQGVENQVVMPIQNHLEMDMTLDSLANRLATVNYYPQLFQNAFGSTEINADKISKALAQFVQSLVSYKSKFDKGYETNFVNFSQLERDGMNLYNSGAINCNHCHTTVNFYTNQSLVNGLDEVYADQGLGTLTGDPQDNGKFKVPSLRNIAVSGPYMHDGRFKTLEEVVEHYNSGIKAHPNLDDRLAADGMTGGPPKRYNMTDYQKKSLVAFLKTLTDYEFLYDKRFSNPFKP
ncbi:MAG: cytochrome-c peroxidase [Flavobacteriia bacterium]|nr:cytochrome-c peroxidase [Flavobacteriia bacterium]